MTDFADFWTRVEGHWLDKHAYYHDVGSCFPGRVSVSRREAFFGNAVGITIGLAVIYFAFIPAMAGIGLTAK